MGKITSIDLYNSTVFSDKEMNKWNQVMRTPIVPRKMVEMIIKRCQKDYEIYGEKSFAGKEARGE